MNKRFKWGLKVLLLLLIGVLLAVAFGVIPINLFFAKTAISDTVKQNLGVELDINGSLSLRLGFNPALSASSLEFLVIDQPDKSLLSVEKLIVRPVLFDVLRGDIHLKYLEVSSAVVNYCPEGLATLDESPSDGKMPSVAVDLLLLKSLHFECDQPHKSIAHMPQNINLELKAGLGKPAHAEVSGLIMGEKVNLVASTTSSINGVLFEDSPIPIEATLSGFDSSIGISGEILDLYESPGLVASVLANSHDPAALLELAGIESVTLSPFDIKTDVVANHDRVEVKQLVASIGQTQFNAEGVFRDFATRPYMQVGLQLLELDVQWLNESLGQSTAQGSQTTQDFGPWLDQLQSFDAELRLSVDEVFNAPVPMRKIKLVTQLKDGLLSIEQGSGYLAESQVDLNAEFDTTRDCPPLTSELHISGVDLGGILHLLNRDDGLEGSAALIEAKLSSCGSNFDDHLQSFHIEGGINDAFVRIEGLEEAVVFDQVLFETAYAEPGRLITDGLFMGERLKAEIGFGPISKILGETSWPLAMRLEGSDANFLLDGNAAIIGGSPRLQARMEVGVAYLGKLHRWINITPTSALAGNAKANIKLGQDDWSVTAIDIQLGKSQVQGAATLSGGLQGILTVSLSSNLLDMSELNGLLPQAIEEEEAVTPAEQYEDDLIERLLKIPALNYTLSVGEVTGLNLDVRDIRVTGKVQDRFNRDGHLDLTVEDIQISGKLNTDLRNKPWKLDYAVHASNVDIGRLLARLDLAHDVVAQADQAVFNLVSEGRSIRELATNAHLYSRFENVDWRGDLIPDDIDEDALQLSSVEFTAAPSRKIEWSASGYLNEVPVEFWFQTPTLSETFDVSTAFAYRLVLRSGMDVAIMDALMDRRKDDYFKTDFTLSGQTMETAEVSLAKLVPPLAEYELSAHLFAGTDMLELGGIEARVGSSLISGELKINQIRDHIKLDADFQSSYLETDDFVAWAERWRRADESPTADNVADVPVTESQAGFFAIFNRYLDDLSEDYLLDVDVEVEQLYSAEQLLGDVHLRMTLDENEFRIDPLKIDMPQGSFNADYYGRNSPGGIESSLNIHAEQLEFGGLIRLADPDSTASGQLFLDTSLKSTAPTWQQLQKSMEGQIELLVIPEKISANFLDLWTSNLVFALLPLGDKKEKHLNCLAARFKVEDGVMKSKSILLDSTDVIVRGRGSIDLAESKLNLLFAPQAKREEFYSVSTPIKVKGPFSDYQVGLSSGGFVTTMFKWYTALIYVPYKWLTGERFPADGLATCYDVLDLEAP